MTSPGSSAVAQDAPDLEAAAGPGRAGSWTARLRDALPVLGLLGLVAWFTSASPYFLDAVNATNLLTDASTLLVCAFGMTLVILIGEIDLSVAAMVSLLAVVLARLLGTGLPWPVVLALVLLAGVAIGLLNGALTGGRASLTRTLLGVLLIAVLNNGLTLLNVDSSLQYVIKGVIILIAVLLDRSAAAQAGR